MSPLFIVITAILLPHPHTTRTSFMSVLNKLQPKIIFKMKLFYGILPLLVILLFKFVLPEFTYRKASHPVQDTRNTIHVSKKLHKAEKKQFIIPPRPPLRRPVLHPLPRPPPRLLIDELSPFLVPAIPSVVGKKLRIYNKVKEV